MSNNVEEQKMVDQEEEGKEQTKGNKGIIKEIIFYAALFLICLLVIPRYVFCKYTVDGRSMKNTLETAQQLIGEKVSYHFSDPDRFDIVVVRPFEDQKKNYYVKRVIGLPGETIEVKNDTILINGKELEDNYKREPMLEQQVGPIELGDDEYFVMGDNRNESGDSREEVIGAIPRDRIIAHIVLRVWPLKKVRAFS